VDIEGSITVGDRKKDMIRSGENVAGREVGGGDPPPEGVSEVAVIGLPHPIWVEAVAAVVVVKSGATSSEPECSRVVRSASRR